MLCPMIKVTAKGVDVSRTEELLEAFASALEVRNRIQAIRERYQKMGDPSSFGEMPLDQALNPVEMLYLEKLDRLRAQLSASGVQV